MNTKNKLHLDKAEIVEEHERLVKVLKGASHKERLKEATKQQKELAHYKAKHNNKDGV